MGQSRRRPGPRGCRRSPPCPSSWRVGQTESVGRRAVAGHLPQNGCSPSLGVLELLQDNHPGSLAEDETVAVAIERAAGSGRLGIAGRERGEEVEAGHAERVDHAMGAAREHHVGVASTDDLNRFADRLRAGGAGGEAIRVRPPRTEDPGEVAGGGARLLLGFMDRMQVLSCLARVKHDVSTRPSREEAWTSLTKRGKSSCPSPEPR